MNPFCREQKKDSDASGIHKTTKNTPAFGTRGPERTFCVLRCERAKHKKLLNMAIEIGDLPIKKCDFP